MQISLPRRQFVLSLMAVTAGGALLASCGEEAADTPPGAQVPQPDGRADVSALMADGSLPEKALGSADAPVTIVEYASMTCPHCASFHISTLPAIKEKYIDTGKARLLFREFPLEVRAEAGAMLARCSNDKFFAMVDVLFQQQRNWAAVQNVRDSLLQIARLAGFSQESFEACLTDQKLVEDIRAVRARAASEFKVESTPTFFINGDMYKGALTVDVMSAIIDSKL